MDIDTLCESTKLRLIACALGLQQCTKTAACIIPLPSTDNVIAIGTKADVARLLGLEPADATTQASTAQAGRLKLRDEAFSAVRAFGDCEYEHAMNLGKGGSGVEAKVANAEVRLAAAINALVGPIATTSSTDAQAAADAVHLSAEGCAHVADAIASDPGMIEAAAQDAAERAAAEVRDAAPAEPIECWSRDEEDFNAHSLGELIDSHDEWKPGDTVWVGKAVHPDPADMVSVDSIIENIGEAAYDIAGEHAEDYPDVTDEQCKELEMLVVDWLKRAALPTFYTVENIKPYVLTADDLSLPAGDTGEQADGGEDRADEDWFFSPNDD